MSQLNIGRKPVKPAFLESWFFVGKFLKKGFVQYFKNSVFIFKFLYIILSRRKELLFKRTNIVENKEIAQYRLYCQKIQII